MFFSGLDFMIFFLGFGSRTAKVVRVIGGRVGEVFGVDEIDEIGWISL